MKKILVLVFISLISANIFTRVDHENERFPQFILITSLYNEKHPGRVQEYITCLKKNLKHSCISEIHVLYDTKKDDSTNVLRSFLEEQSICLTFITGRPTYGYIFRLAADLYPDKIIIIANADIYFNNTLELLHDYDWENKFFAISRWNVQKNNTIKLYKSAYSQDVWIFHSPLMMQFGDDVMLGTQHCDGRIAFRAKKAGLRIFNPCHTIQCCHLHHSKIRNYPFSPAPFHEMFMVKKEKLRR